MVYVEIFYFPRFCADLPDLPTKKSEEGLHNNGCLQNMSKYVNIVNVLYLCIYFEQIRLSIELVIE